MSLWLTRKDVQSVLTMRDAIEAVEDGFRRLAQNKVILPQRTAIRLTEQQGLHLGMPAFIGGEGGDTGVLALKSVTVFPGNPAKFALPTTLATLLLMDPKNGALLAIMEAGFLTAMRTGAASGVATKYLARENASTVGIFGAGAQARTQLQAICAVRRIESVRVCDPVAEARERFIKELSAQLSATVTEADSKTCAQSDIVVTATSSKTPVFDGTWLKAGTHINGIGSHSPDARELDTETIVRSRIIADHVASRLAEDADFMIPLKEGSISESHIEISLGEVIAGLKPGRTSEEEITLFKSGGLAVQDAITAAKVYDLARRSGVGREVEG